MTQAVGAPHPSDEVVGALIGELRVVAHVGDGETGAWYEAWNPAGDQRALHVFHRGVQIPNLASRLKAMRGEDAPVVEEVGALDDGRLFLVAPWVDDLQHVGQSLSRALKPPEAVFHTTAEIVAQQAEVRAPPAVRASDDAPERPRRPRGVVVAGVLLLAVAVGVLGWWKLRATPAPPPPAQVPVVEPPRLPPPSPQPEARPVKPPTRKELVARAKAMTAELKQRPATTYDARVELRRLLQRSEANPDEAERSAIGAELDQWQRAYLPAR